MEITVGNLLDQLSIENIRIWVAEDIKRDKKATHKKIANATMVTNIANQKRNDLIQAIDETIIKMIKGKSKIKSYKQGSSKMYGKK